MKKTLLLLCMAAGLLSCTKEMTLQEEAPAGVPMKFEISVAGTKAEKSEWAEGDRIYVFFKGLEKKYLILTYESDNSWSNNPFANGTILDSDFSALSDRTLTAVHFPVGVKVEYTNNQFKFSADGKPVYHYYLFQADKEYEVVDGTTVNATLQMGKPADFVQFHVKDLQYSIQQYAVSMGCTGIRPVACAGVGVDGTINEDVLQAGARMNGIIDSDGGLFAGRLVDPDESSYTITLARGDELYSWSRSGKLIAGNMYNFPFPWDDDRWEEEDANGPYDIGAFVDLGLSVEWGKWNLGASSNEESGNYYAWGELHPSNNYRWDNYLYGDGYHNALTKYCSDASYGLDGFTDTLTILAPEDDAAYAALGGRCRIPTEKEWEELMENCTWEWLSNKRGFLIKSKKPGYTDKQIFLPAGGRLYDNCINGYEGEAGWYWSSSLRTSRPTDAVAFYFSGELIAGSMQDITCVSYDRYTGFPIRPVCGKD